MADRSCGCAVFDGLGSRCSAEATQEDLLCDACRVYAGATRVGSAHAAKPAHETYVPAA